MTHEVLTDRTDDSCTPLVDAKRTRPISSPASVSIAWWLRCSCCYQIKLSNQQDRANQEVQIELPHWKQNKIDSWGDLSWRTEITAQPNPRHCSMRDQKQSNCCCKSKMNCTNQKESASAGWMKGDTSCKSAASCQIEELQHMNHSSIYPRADGLLDTRITAPSAACGILSSRHQPGRRMKGIAQARLCLSSPMRFVFGSHGDLGSSAPPNSLGCVPVPLDLGPRRVDPNLDYHDSLSIQQTMLRLSSSINKTWSCNFYLLFTKKK